MTRVVALWADLDIAPGKCPDVATAWDVVNEVSGFLGMRPMAVTESGHGLHPYWPIEDGEQELPTLADRKRFLARFRRFVEEVADRRQCQVDNVFDPPRILRVPESVNYKDIPVPVVCRKDTGGPLTVQRVREAFAELGIDEYPEDGEPVGAQVSAPEEWTWAARTCSYLLAMIDGWAQDVPSGGRHQWLFSQCIRLTCARRLGHISEADYARAVAVLADRMQWLVVNLGQVRKVGRAELPGALRDAIPRVAAKTDEEVEKELGALLGLPHKCDAVPLVQPPPAPGSGTPTGDTATGATHERDSWDAVDLLSHTFPLLVWAIPEFYPPGAVILSGPPKQGKSFLALASGVAIATGQPFLGMPTTKGRVLYCALEDGARRAQLRLRMMPGHERLESGMLTIRTVAPRVDEGLMDVLNGWVKEKGSFPARVVVLDVFQRVRSARTTAGKNPYGEDYAALEGLQRWANQNGICLVILHHNRKASSEDPFEMVSGSTGMTGVVDMIMVLRGLRGAKEAALYTSGRDTKFDNDYSLVRVKGIWERGLMPVDLVTAQGRSGAYRDTWMFLREQGPNGATTEQVAQRRGTSGESVRHHLASMAERGWVKQLNAPAPDVPARWGAVTDDCWVRLP